MVSTLNAVMTERQLQDAIVEAATRLGWLPYHTYDSRRSEAGFPDLVLVRDGVILVYELKTETGRMRPMQREWLDALDGATVQTSRVIRPSDLDDVLRELQEAA
jgi:hypothetical protein